MKRAFLAWISAVVWMLALTVPALGHNMTVTNPHTGQVVVEHWIGGFTVPAQADTMFGPYNLPPSHRTGLVAACRATESSRAVDLQAPPYFTGCEHGKP